MSDPTSPAAPPPGWYREGPDSAGYRWWDGRAWTEHRTAAVSRGAVDQPPLAPGTSVGTAWIWLLSLLPLASLGAEQPVLSSYAPIVREQIRVQRELLANPGTAVPLPSGYGNLAGLLALSWGLSLLLIGLGALVAYLDWRTLRSRSIIRPFPWGWGFLSSVYVVGRAVVVRRRTGRGLAPLAVAIGIFVLAMAVQFAEFLSIPLRLERS